MKQPSFPVNFAGLSGYSWPSLPYFDRASIANEVLEIEQLGQN
jgi:hypothetical protein